MFKVMKPRMVAMKAPNVLATPIRKSNTSSLLMKARHKRGRKPGRPSGRKRLISDTTAASVLTSMKAGVILPSSSLAAGLPNGNTFEISSVSSGVTVNCDETSEEILPKERQPIETSAALTLLAMQSSPNTDFLDADLKENSPGRESLKCKLDKKGKTSSVVKETLGVGSHVKSCYVKVI